MLRFSLCSLWEHVLGRNPCTMKVILWLTDIHMAQYGLYSNPVFGHNVIGNNELLITVRNYVLKFTLKNEVEKMNVS